MAIFTIPSFIQQAAQIRRRLLAGNSSDFSTVPGSVVGDLFVTPQAVSDVQQKAISYLVATALSVTDILALQKDVNTLNLLAQALNTNSQDVIATLSQFLESWGRNFGVTRRNPTTATGTVKWGRATPTQFDITIGPGKIVRTSGGVEFRTTASVTMLASVAGGYYDQNLGFYAIEAAVEAVNPGASGNASAGAVNLIGTSVSGLNIVTNDSPITGGADLESDDDFGARILNRWLAIGRLTEAGIADSVLAALAIIADTYVSKTGDPLSVRGAGYTDLWVKGEVVTQFTETFNNFNDPLFPGSVRLSKSPALDLISVDSGTAIMRRDTTSAISGSIRANDHIQFTAAPSFPVTVTYTYDAAVEASQNVFNDGTKAPLNQEVITDDFQAVRAPILVRRAIPVDVNYAVATVIQPGQTPALVKAAVVGNLAILSNSYRMGVEQFLSDANQVVEETAGMLRITHVILFALDGRSGVADSIQVAKNQYVRLKNVTIL